MIEHFSLERVNKAPASFDPQEAVGVPGSRRCSSCRSSRRWPACCRILQQAGLVAEPAAVRHRAVPDADRRSRRRPHEGRRRHPRLRRLLHRRRRSSPTTRRRSRSVCESRRSAGTARRISRKHWRPSNRSTPRRSSTRSNRSSRKGASRSATSSTPSAWRSPAKASASACSTRWRSSAANDASSELTCASPHLAVAGLRGRNQNCRRQRLCHGPS